MAALAVRAWQLPAKIAVLADEKRKILEAKILRDLHENAPGVMVAESNGTLCGWGAQVPKSNYISDLWIDSPFRRQGIGGRILDALIAQIMLDGFSEALIGTHADNLPAIGLYQKFGFVIEWRGEEWSESLGREVEKLRLRRPL
ncbi:GNAT family N-acetyltransferase [Brucella sp. BE17]|uniref:GNAT family N-acetyltransferase n=1 Tax=Brucella sp. BE17 TaxID=3142977 RepID=UPI0031BA5FD3